LQWRSSYEVRDRPPSCDEPRGTGRCSDAGRGRGAVCADGGVEKIRKEDKEIKGDKGKRKRKMVVYPLRHKASVAMVFVSAKFLQVLLGL
jgi:hypothetical protein